MQIFDIYALPPTPWKNGGGVTREIVCQPPHAGHSHFDWRVSVANLEQSGPFSIFEGVDRVIMLLDGDGVRLSAPQANIDHQLSSPFRPFAFSGDIKIDCTLIGGSSTDFNVMCRRNMFNPQISILQASQTINASQRGVLLAQRGTWVVQGVHDRVRCTVGQGIWWENETQAWQATTEDKDAVMVWVSLNEMNT